MNNRHTKQGESVYMRHVIYFDVETQRSVEEVGGWDHVERLGLALAVTYDTRDNTYKTYDEVSVTNLVEALSAANLVIGFNHLKFDYRVLSAYTNADLHSLPNFDMLAQLSKDEGFRVGLDELGQHTLDRGKTAHGLQSIEWWKRGEIDRVAEYCKQDVALTRELFLHARNKGYLLCGSGNGVSRLDTKHWKGIVTDAIRSGTLEAIRRDIIAALSAGDEDEIQVLMGNLDTLYSERREKLEGYSHVIRNAEAEAKALGIRRQALSKLAKLLRGTLLDDMGQQGETQTNAGRFRLQRGNKARVVLDIDAVDLPEAYQRIMADKNALRRALRTGKAIEGVELESTEFVSIFRRPHRTRRQHPLPSQADTGAGADNSGPAIKVSAPLEAIRRDIIAALSVGDEDEIQVLMGNLDTLYSERREKLEGYSHVIRNAEAEAKALGTRVKALSKLAKLLRGTLLDDMRQQGETQTNAGRFRLQRGNKARVVLDIDAVDLPEAYQRITADKIALRKVLIGGEAIEGVELESTEFVSIRTRRQQPLPSQIKVSDRLLDIHNTVDRLYKSSDLSKICADYAGKCEDAADAGEPEPALTEWERGELYRIAEKYELMVGDIEDQLYGEPNLTEWEEYESMVDDIEDQLYGVYELTERYREQLEELRHQLVEELAEREELEWEWDLLKWIVDAIEDVLYGE